MYGVQGARDDFDLRGRMIQWEEGEGGESRWSLS